MLSFESSPLVSSGLRVGLLALALTSVPGYGQGNRRPGNAGQANRQVPGFPFEIPGMSGNPFFEPFEPFFGGRGDNAGEDAELEKVELSVREEQEYGEQVWQSFQEEFKRRKITFTTRGREVDYLRRVVETLRPQMKNEQRYRSIRIVFADSDLTDAYSIPGGTLVVFRGMLEFADSEAALAGVLGHELAHLDRGHQLRPVKRMKYARASSTRTKFDPAAMFRQANVFMSAFLRPFRPEDESAADRDGATWAYRSGYDPRALCVLFAKLNERDDGGRFAPSFLRTHPYHADRQAAIEELYAQLQAAEPRGDLYLGRANLRRLISMSERRFEE